ncbi:disease resistance protein RPM1-like [Rosa chinensis]|nr:disease resistance protein RPM1-like [Rosa chinensis]
MTEVAVPASLASVEKMKLFLYQLSDCPSKVHEEVKSAKRCLEILQAYLADSKDNNVEDSQMLKDCSDIAHDIEDALDEFNSEVAPLFHSNKLSHKIQHVSHILQLRKASTKLSSKINEQIKLVKRLHFKDSSFEGDLDPKASIWKGRTELDLTPKIQEDEMVGYEESKARLHKQLMEEDSRLLTISIVGPGGSGKTTLVKNLYNMVQGVFDSRYWIDVSRP